MLQNNENCFSDSLDEKPGADLGLKIGAGNGDSGDEEKTKTDERKLQIPDEQSVPAGSNPSLKVARNQQVVGLAVPTRRSGSRSRCPSMSSISSSCSSTSYSTQSSRSSRSRGRGRQRSRRHGSRRSRSWSSSRSRSRPRPRCHRAASRSTCSRRHRRSPPRRYRAHSRSYSRSPSPRWHRRRRVARSRSRSWSRSRSRSRSAGHRLYGFVGRTRFIRSPSRRSRSRSRSPIGANIHLSLDDKRELLKIAQANAAKALGVETLELPASVKSILAEPVEPSHMQRMRSEGSVLRNPFKQDKAREVEDDVPSPKSSPKNKVITFSMHNSVARPTTSKAASSSPESPASTREDSVTGGSPYGQWVPIKARSFPLPAHKQSPYKTR